MGFVEWLFEPVANILDALRQPNEEEIRNPIIIPGNSNIINKLNYRPRNFDEYIGQTKAKEIIKSYIEATRKRNICLPHILIYGSAGCGKTTLAKIISNEIKSSFLEVITSTVKNPFDLIYQINSKSNSILFLDEIHSIDRSTAESIYSTMEDFYYNGIQLNPFTIIGATTEYGEMLKDRKPFVDRFKIIIELEDYTTEDLEKLTKQYKNITFPMDSDISEETFNIIAKNSRKTPRTCIRLLEATIYLNGNIEKVLHNFSIIKDGYTEKDLKILKYIELNEKGIGLQGLTSYLNTSQQNYIYNIEPYLLKNELILRTSRGRKITEKGKNKIIELENVLARI